MPYESFWPLGSLLKRSPNLRRKAVLAIALLATALHVGVAGASQQVLRLGQNAP